MSNSVQASYYLDYGVESNNDADKRIPSAIDFASVLQIFPMKLKDCRDWISEYVSNETMLVLMLIMFMAFYCSIGRRLMYKDSRKQYKYQSLSTVEKY
ncbi:hypothetical protein L596_010606 [Steinernema carpocapsae]|uniref:Uncharacterized protein n=1 Tax=Steinernema carpocapsae TaxID=34508 RepID=A0A4U5PJ15_STECR|nr:hypothetical protein L596_010606 [Steinernema carpocapsae]